MTRTRSWLTHFVAIVLMICSMVGFGALAFGRQASEPSRPSPTTQPSQTAPDQDEQRQAQVRAKLAEVVARTIGRAHGYSTWRSKGAVQADIVVRQGETVIEGVMTYDIRGKRSRLDLKNGAILVFDGEQAWVTPADAPFERARYHLQIWPFFFAAAFRMQEPGMVYSHYAMRTLRGESLDSFMLSYEPGMGDWPDDWYLCFAEPKSHELRSMVYITTYGGRTRQDAEEDIHAIVYESYNTVDKLILPVQCSLWKWNANRGIHGEQLGSVEFRKIRFVQLDAGLFAKPMDAREDQLPGAEERPNQR